MPGPARNLWVAAVERNPDHARNYAQRWRDLAARGDIDGEARLIDAMAARGARILDAGCGTGRVGGYLLDRGHDVVGVDLDPDLIAVAQEDHPRGRWLVQNLAELALAAPDGGPEYFDLVVCAGQVMTFLADAERIPVLERMRVHLATGGRIVVGFGTARGYPAEDFEADATRAGLRMQLRTGGWDLSPYTGDFLVAVLEDARAR
jgi:SAM-dependent methyltransferase